MSFDKPEPKAIANCLEKKTFRYISLGQAKLAIQETIAEMQLPTSLKTVNYYSQYLTSVLTTHASIQFNFYLSSTYAINNNAH